MKEYSAYRTSGSHLPLTLKGTRCDHKVKVLTYNNTQKTQLLLADWCNLSLPHLASPFIHYQWRVAQHCLARLSPYALTNIVQGFCTMVVHGFETDWPGRRHVLPDRGHGSSRIFFSFLDQKSRGQADFWLERVFLPSVTLFTGS